MKAPRILALSCILLASTRCYSVDGVDHLGNLTKNAEALKQDIGTFLSLTDKLIEAKLNELAKLNKELMDFQEAVKANIKQKRDAMAEIFRDIKPFEGRLLFLKPEKKEVWEKIAKFVEDIK